jgi:hypothetical protein
MKGWESFGSMAQILCRAPGRCLDEWIGPGFKIEIGIERLVDQRIGKAVELDHGAGAELDVEKAEQRLMHMGEEIGRRHQLPGLTPAIVDGEEGFLFLDPAHHGQKV